jgi:hypothetical protein
MAVDSNCSYLDILNQLYGLLGQVDSLLYKDWDFLDQMNDLCDALDCNHLGYLSNDIDYWTDILPKLIAYVESHPNAFDAE